MHRLVIRDARVPDEMSVVRALFEEYAASLDVDLCFQDFGRELAELRGDYGAPRGCLLVANDGTQVVGCVALRPLAGDDPAVGEIKRLYLRPDARGSGAGRALAAAVIERARAAGYRVLKLDTLASMTAARALYASLGFSVCEAYYRNPLPGVTYMTLDLTLGSEQ